MVLKLTNYKVAKEICSKYHYSKTVPSSKFYFAFYEDDELVGVITYGLGANNNLIKHFKCEWSEILELTRIAFKEHKEHITKAISLSFKWLRMNTKYIHCVSYSDTAQGHKGIIYKAFGFEYQGLRKIHGNDYFSKIENRLIKGRSFWGKAKSKGLTEKEFYMQNLDNYIKIPKSDKHRWYKKIRKTYRKTKGV